MSSSSGVDFWLPVILVVGSAILLFFAHPPARWARVALRLAIGLVLAYVVLKLATAQFHPWMLDHRAAWRLLYAVRSQFGGVAAGILITLLLAGQITGKPKASA